MGKTIKWCVKAAIFLIMLSGISMDSHAYFGKNEDYFFTDEQPEDRGRTHYLEFVSKETYTVKIGDTLWGIAEDYWGKGTYYQRILSDNEDVVDIPEHLMPGMELDLRKTQYMNVGIEDYINQDQFAYNNISGGEAFGRIKRNDRLPYCIYPSYPYVNDLKEADPYVHWDEFKEEVSRCSREVCGDLVSDLLFERYQVTGIGSLCGYSFTFDAGDEEYVIMAYFCYNKTTKSEAFALCEKKSCTETVLEMVRGKTCYAAVRFLDSRNGGAVKAQDYVGAEMWNYPQLRNPFVSAMQRFYSSSLKQVEDYQDDYAIAWKEPEVERLVREELSKLWQLTEEEKQAFMERDVTAGDLALIEEMVLAYYSIEYDEKEYLRVRLNGSADYGTDITLYPPMEGRLLDALEDLGHFRGLKSLTIDLRTSSITDLSCLENLVDLKVLKLYIYSEDTQVNNLDFFRSLTNLRTLYIGGWSWEQGYGKYFRGITDLSILRSCPHLTYLSLATVNVENYDFLGDLPELYYVSLYRWKKIVPDESLLPNACFIEINGDYVRFENGGGYEQY